MILKKITIGILAIGFFSGCAQNVALLGPSYTLVTSGNLYQAGFSYGGNQIITKTISKPDKKEDTDFEILVKKNIEETRKKLNFSNQ